MSGIFAVFWTHDGLYECHGICSSSAMKGKKSFKKYFRISKTTGKVTVRKGLKKGTYKVKVTVQANGNGNYIASARKTVTFKVRVR